jgi:histone H3/H4
MRLIRRPFKPTAQDVAIMPTERLMRKIGDQSPKTWEQFIGKMYFDVELRE